ncbi:MAG: SPFH domain-containing protein [Gemmatimonadaceae bacterium]|jgi:regulator of protease activity HflC (stomatin/prohibitin superfamily)|nr:SPFH domain-containing protein [Gemmatimonadota bacterium]MBP9106297.1 SPFH domain-containing protein [Gemmatimonadaceae bacterium]MBK7834557.1 SPFH domain-containing protein [Gemmatimonadota bacterium]MBK8056689.1 SPFH domain-containing protein [Gemmatimonadota bacterium]MBK9408207.1 SPFH domain-containing protein [Gemmatimonadota bacterium]
MLREINKPGTSGLLMVFLGILLLGLGVWRVIVGADGGSPLTAISGAILLLTGILTLSGLFTVQPNEGKVLTLFGKYVGTVRESGLFWANPFFTKKAVSLRIRNFETAKLKVNDNHSNPIEIGAVVVWKVVDTAEAVFEVDDYTHFVVMQSEAAVRALAQSYPYDAHGVDEIALSTHPADVSKALQQAVADRLHKAGVEVIEARLSHLAYAPEIANAMLRRQQAAAIIAARSKIVEGAVGMVENALTLISDRGLVTLDDERKASMVSNLLVVLCSDRDAQPVVNAGTLYQ